MKKTLAGLIALGLLYIGAEYWFGMQAEHWYRDALLNASARPGLKLVPMRYERGLLVSHAITRVEVFFNQEDGAGEPDLTFTTREEIFHGPLPLAALGRPGVPFRPGGAVVRQTLDPDSAEWLHALATSAAGEVPLEVITQVGLTGESRTRITSPLLILEHIDAIEHLRLEGLDARISFKPSHSVVALDLQVNALTIKAAEGANTSSKVGAVSLQGLTLNLEQPLSGADLPVGDGQVVVNAIRLDGTDPQDSVAIAGLKLDTKTRDNAEDPRLIDVEQRFSVDEVRAEGVGGSANLRLLQRRLDRRALSQLQATLTEKAQGNAEPKAADPEQLRLAHALLQAQPETLVELTVQTQEGDLSGQIDVHLREVANDSDLGTPQALLAIVRQATLELSVAQSLADTVAARIGAEKPYPEALSAALSNALIRSEDAHLKATVRFEQGRLQLNGREIPLPAAAQSTNTDAANKRAPESLPAAANPEASSSTGARAAILEQMVRDGEVTLDCAREDREGAEIVSLLPIDLNRDGSLEYEVSGNPGCACLGARRCASWIYQTTPGGYRQILEQVQPDEGIGVLATQTLGYPDLEVVGWAGDEALREVFRFDGRAYRSAGLKPLSTPPSHTSLSDLAAGQAPTAAQPAHAGAEQAIAAAVITVGEKTVSYWPSVQDSGVIEFQADMKGYRNTYALDCARSQFRWIRNVKLETGAITEHANGAQWRPLSASSTLASAVYQAACGRSTDGALPDPAQAIVSQTPSAEHSTDSDALTAADLARYESSYRARFSALCSDPYTRESGLPCPYIQKGSCEGEGCVSRGPMRANEALALSAFPGSDRAVAHLAPQEDVFAEYGEVWLAPCKARVSAKAQTPQAHEGDLFWRLGYVGEGFSAYWSATATEQFEDSSMDTISANSPPNNPCDMSTHGEWLLLTTASGQRGWTDRPGALAGSDLFGGDDLSDSPDWVREREASTPLPIAGIYTTVLGVKKSAAPPSALPSSDTTAASPPPDTRLTEPTRSVEEQKMAQVNAPGDGFLALRSEPSASKGSRLAKIPHGTVLTLGECVGAPGQDHWCRTAFRGQSGWVFERYLIDPARKDGQALKRTVHSPPKGDPLRQAILDAIRAEYNKPVKFLVHRLDVRGEWAWAAVTGTLNGQPAYEGDGYVLHRTRGAWRVVDSVNASDPVLVEQRYRQMKTSYPDAPIP